MIDSHAHIVKEYYTDIEGLVKELQEKKVRCVINCSTSIESCKEILELSKKTNNFLLPALGIHPDTKDDFNKTGELEELVMNNKIIAIGEIGLDYYWTKDNKEQQKELFTNQLDIAQKYNLPILVHTRDSIQDTFDILKERKLKGIIHCYSGSYEMAKEFIKLGYKLGIGGVLTFKNSKLYEVIEKISLNDIVLETDSPYLSPEPLRGKQNNPYNIYYVAKRIAEIKKVTIEEVIEQTTKNACDIFDF